MVSGKLLKVIGACLLLPCLFLRLSKLALKRFDELRSHHVSLTTARAILVCCTETQRVENDSQPRLLTSNELD
jgi:hypothetical protein